MSFAEIAEFVHEQELAAAKRKSTVEAFRTTRGEICQVWQDISTISHKVLAASKLYPEGSRERAEMETLYAYYDSVSKRLDGVQAPGELNLYGAHTRLAMSIK